ncbi:unnamed protein product [Angiostrongylus costaricensis]|uniref:Uncharacterized protein n=1 Tax=Angiostrongylus costaricensis TaxID=334426 RepID=A0A0R3PDC3_ANGCS|nr:unnamed protein product [Angiostrongylus costaricensis]
MRVSNTLSLEWPSRLRLGPHFVCLHLSSSCQGLLVGEERHRTTSSG